MYLLERALERASRLGASYADARRVNRKTQGILVRDGALETISEGSDEGYGVRVLVDGAWGFAASNSMSEEDAAKTAGLAVEYAKAARPMLKRKAEIGECRGEAAYWKAPIEVDPFTVPIGDKVGLLIKATLAAKGYSPKVRQAKATMDFITEKKLFMSTEGARIEQEFTESGAGVTVMALGDGDMQVRSYPGSFGGNFKQAGYEFVLAQRLEEGALKSAEEAVALLTAEQCPSGEMTLILLPEQLALQIHESCGPPSKAHLFGTDALGRDVFTRVAFGARISLAVGIAAAFISLLIGVFYGGISGFIGGRTDNIMMRIVDILYSVPTLLIVILLMVVLGASLTNVFIALGITYWLEMARIVRGQVLSLKEQEFTLAARALGASKRTILVKHLIPNTMGPIIITATFLIPEAIFFEAFLSFIGLGVSAPMASWGVLANDGIQGFQSHPSLLFIPAAFISITMLSFNFLGDGLRDALDPRLRK